SRGAGSVVLVGGEAGIGKTRLVDELCTIARSLAFRVLPGRCWDGAGAPAFWPWMQIIRAHARARDPIELLAELGSGAAEIAQVVPEVAARLPGLPLPPELPAEQARFRLFDSVTSFLRNVAAAQPLLLVLDDLHWADLPSLHLLRFVVRELRDARVVIVGTHRELVPEDGQPRRQALVELDQEPHVTHLFPRSLSPADVAQVIEAMVRRGLPDGCAAAVHRRSGGNPLAVTEIARHLAAEGAVDGPDVERALREDVPPSLREMLAARLARLSEPCRQVLAIAAVVGPEFAVPLVEGVSGVGADRFLVLLEEAEAARIVDAIAG